ncbi:hypothetical protein R6Q57_006461 [Mikania cordata]
MNQNRVLKSTVLCRLLRRSTSAPPPKSSNKQPSSSPATTTSSFSSSSHSSSSSSSITILRSNHYSRVSTSLPTPPRHRQSPSPPAVSPAHPCRNPRRWVIFGEEDPDHRLFGSIARPQPNSTSLILGPFDP